MYRECYAVNRNTNFYGRLTHFRLNTTPHSPLHPQSYDKLEKLGMLGYVI